MTRLGLFVLALLGAAATASAQTLVQWQSAANGNWFTAGAWSGGVVPSNTVAAINAAGPAYVVTAGGASSISLTSLGISSSSAQLLFDFSSTSPALNLGVGASSWTAGLVEFRNGAGIAGSSIANSALTIGSGTELLYSTATGTRYLNNLTVSNSGKIHATSGALALNSLALTNLSGGLVHADGAEIDFNSSTTLANLGTLRATGVNGKLYFYGSRTVASLGAVDLVSGGHAYLAGTFTNATTLAAPSGGSFELLGGTITGGSVASGALTFTSNTGTLNNVSLAGDLTLPASSRVTFTGGTSFLGANATFNDYSKLNWQQSGTLASKALSFGNGALLQVIGASNSLTLDGNSTATGNVQIYSDGSAGTAFTNQGTITHNSGTGNLYAKSFANTGTITAAAGSTLNIGPYYSTGYTTANSGTITADGTDTIINFNGNLANTGTITAKNAGQIFLASGSGPAQTTGNLGTVEISNGGHVYLYGSLDNTAATLTAPSGGAFELYSGTINHGAVAAGALTFTSHTGTLNDVSFAGDLTLPASSKVTFTGGTAFLGANATLNDYSNLYWQQTGTLASKALAFGNGALLQVIGTGNSLTLDANSTATGQVQIYSDGSSGTSFTNQGTINHNLGTGNLYAKSFTNTGSITAAAGSTLNIGPYYSTGYTTTNSGTITADGTDTIVNFYGNVANTGTIKAKNSGQIFLAGSSGPAQTTGNLGTVEISNGGHVYLYGSLDNTAATLTAPSGGAFELYSGTINHGAVAAGALTFTSHTGTLNDISFAGDLTLPASSKVTFTGGTAFLGANATLNDYSKLYWQQNGTLVGKTITFGTDALLEIISANNALTLDSTSNATGEVQIYSDGSTNSTFINQGTINHTSGYGYIYAPVFSNSGTITAAAGSNLSLGYYYYNVSSATNTSSGIITADGTNAVINVYGDFINNGTFRAQNSGQLIFSNAYGNSIVTSHLGTVQLTNGGHAYLDGTLDNTSATLNPPSGGSFELYSGTINNGTVAAGALTFTTSGGTLSNVSLLGSYNFPSSSYAYFTAGTNFNTAGASVALGNSAWLYWQQSGTLAGHALTFGTSAGIEISGANHTLTFDPTTTATGDIYIYSDNSVGSAFTNQGTITHNSYSGSIHAPTFTNSGTIVAAGGTLYLGSTSTGATFANNAGATLRTTTGATMVLQSPAATPIVNHGLIDVQSGTLYGGSHLTNGSNGQVRGAGVIRDDFELAGGTIAPGNNGVGTLTFSSGSFAVTSASVFEADISGNTADKLVFLNPTSVVNIGSGLLTLSLNLLNAPTSNTTYTLISISSGGSGLSGSFAGLPNSGDTFTALYAGSPVTFAVNYQPNFITLTTGTVIVPEPSTYALIGVGVALLFGLRSRRRRR